MAWHKSGVVQPSSDPMRVFDRIAVRRHRERAAAGLERHDFLAREIGNRLVERLAAVKRTFALTLALGAPAEALAGAAPLAGGALVTSDLSPAMLRRAGAGRRIGAVAADEEWLPFAPERFDLVLGLLSLHWVNDLPGALVQIRQCLKPDGLLLAAMLGGETLSELRRAWVEAEAAEESGASPRISPFVDAGEAASLLQRAGFALPVVDVDTVAVTYPDALALMAELRGMGEANAACARTRRFTRRATLMTAAAAYREHYGDPDGRVPATFQVLTLTAWRHHQSQPKPLRPGSAEGRLAEALDTVEIAAGDKARPR